MAKECVIILENVFNDRGSVSRREVRRVEIDAGGIVVGKALPAWISGNDAPLVRYYDGSVLELSYEGRDFMLRAGGGPAQLFCAQVENMYVHETVEGIVRLCRPAYVSCIDFGGMFRRASFNSLVCNCLRTDGDRLYVNPEGSEWFMQLFWRRSNMFLLDDTSVELLRSAAESGNPQALFGYGRYLYFVHPSVSWAAEAASCLRRASTAGLSEADAALSFLYRYGDLGTVDLDRANKMLRNAADKGCRFAVYQQLAYMLYGAPGIEPDIPAVLEKADRLLAEEPDCPWWHYLRASAVWNREPFSNSREDFEFAARNGVVEAWYNHVLTSCCNEDLEVLDRNSYDRMMDLGAETGNTDCMIVKAFDCLEGCDGIPEYYRRSRVENYILSMEKAFRLGSDLAGVMLGDSYLNGEFGIEADFDKAWKWYSSAAAYGNPEAYEKMFAMIEDGLADEGGESADNCALHGARCGSELLVQETVRAFSAGRLAEYADEIVSCYVPAVRKMESSAGASRDGSCDIWNVVHED